MAQNRGFLSCHESPQILSWVAEEEYNNLNKDVNGYIRVMWDEKDFLFLRCNAKSSVGSGAPAADGYEIVKFVKGLAQHIAKTSLHDTSEAIAKKLWTHFRESKVFCTEGSSNLMMIREARGAVSLNEEYTGDIAKDAGAVNFQPVYYERTKFAEHDKSEWMYIIKIHKECVKVQRRFEDRPYDFEWKVSFKDLTNDKMDTIQNDTNGEFAKKMPRERSAYVTVRPVVDKFFHAVDNFKRELESEEVVDSEITALVAGLLEWKKAKELERAREQSRKNAPLPSAP